ncbi:MAG: hypothetical protein A2408_00845 [Candidatus Yonathbacteria bacterium RIFOXYC1_FULL_52_10]|uniref:Glycosyltransferase subfamily 4-like N-terminal domain-containing protein n=1 Tax=Candidatus Yonathbacteria bacterium RIFOXYD1_FULL_52_36 TaxID=1802730 RepID=A0A1G2SKB7_9BACT|nr:MAG: hypothetical protein A2591_04080 [Candidatus Yonathbacteria bacterium RIFOXYD1_FULL_52_36]OHA85692.1 MAG: hypothetical protein A2408_00845 [Candidatus Yonathbacteria bacterium RIFOXYC1_FULL_52_10]
MDSGRQKILLVITKSNWGGAQRYVYDLATNLPRDRFEVIVACGGSGTLITRLKESGVRVIPLGKLGRDISLGDDLGSFFSLLRILRTEHPDILHLNSSKAGGLGALAGRIAGTHRIIFTAHGFAFNEDRSRLQKTIIKFLAWLTILLSHKTIAVSDAISKQMEALPFVRRRIMVVKNGIPPQVLMPKEQARGLLLPEQVRATLPSDAVWIGTIAELHKVKGLAYAIQAMAILRKQLAVPFAFVVVGEGEERKNLERLVIDLQLTDRVFLVGYKENASSLLPGLDLFTLSSVSEALAYVVLEAGAAGIPCIATSVGGIPEIIEDGVSGLLVPARNPRLIAEAITKLAQDKTLRTSLGETLQHKIATEFSLKKMLSETTAVYRQD